MTACTVTLKSSNDVLSEVTLDALALVQALGLPVEETVSSKVRQRAVTFAHSVDLRLPPVLQCGRCQWDTM